MTLKNYKPIMVVGALALSFASAMPAFALSLTTNSNLAAQVNDDPKPVAITISVSVKADADAKIDARVSALNTLRTRINSMQKVSASEKASLDATIDSSTAAMTSLKAKIDADTNVATFMADVRSITKSYRVYLLILPQGRITVVGDRALTIASLMTDLSAKLQTRITAAQASGKDVTTVNASLADMNSKTADANVQAQAAITEVVSLSPDNGDKTVFSSNQLALKDARAKIKLAASDIKTARQDAGSIVATLKSWNVSAGVSAGATTN